MSIYKFVLRGTNASGDTWNTGYHFDNGVAVGGTAQDATVVAEVFARAWWTGAPPVPGVKDLYTALTSFNDLLIYMLDPTTGRVLDKASVDLGLAGTVAGVALPPQVAMVASLHTKTPGRRGRGRSYLPAPATTACTNQGKISLPACGTVADSVGGALDLADTSGYQPMLYTPGHPNRLIVSVTCGDVFDTQRRRRDALVETVGGAAPASTRSSVSTLLTPLG